MTINPTSKRATALVFLDLGVWSLSEVHEAIAKCHGVKPTKSLCLTSAVLSDLVSQGYAERLVSAPRRTTWAITEEGAVEAKRIKAAWRVLMGDDEDDWGDELMEGRG